MRRDATPATTPAEASHARVLVAIATYNEIENVPRLVADLRRTQPEADVLIVDDNSPDGTGRWCDVQTGIDPRVRCLHRPRKDGLGRAVIAGLQYALEHGYEMVVNMDADFSHSPHAVHQMIAKMQSADRLDVVIGSRYIRGGAIRGWPWGRHVMSRAVNLLARVALGIGVKDCSGSFRCYRVACLRQLDFAKFRSRGYAFFEEILWRLRKHGARFAEIPITFEERRLGRSKIDVNEALGAMATLFRLTLERLTRR